MKKYYTYTLAKRAQPTPEWVAQVRARFPVEKAIDEVFTRKLHNRTQAPLQDMDFTRLQKPLVNFLREQTGQADLEVRDLRRLSGGASKEQFTFSLDWRNNKGERENLPLMLRMDPRESIVETHRLREYQVLRAAWGEVPVPEVLWIDPEGKHLGQPALIAGFLEGTVQPPQPGNDERMSGVGLYFNPELRSALGDQFVKILTEIHAIDWRTKGLSTFDVPSANSIEAAQTSLGLWERAWYEDTLSAHPVMERAALWLRENIPPVDKPVLVHGDYRSGNFMYDKNLKINAIFDWELAYLGDYHDDLAWASLPIFGGPDESGNILASSLMPTETFLRKYEQLSGNPVDHTKLLYYQIFSFYKISVIAAATSIRVAYSQKTHLDAMMNYSGGIGYVGLSQLNRLLNTVS